jgi:hypothetical protein
VTKSTKADEPMAPRETPSTAEMAQARRAEQQAHAARDILDRLRELQAGPAYSQTFRSDLTAAIDEITWLRAARPANAVTRQELGAITEQVRAMRDGLDALLTVLEAKAGS